MRTTQCQCFDDPSNPASDASPLVVNINWSNSTVSFFGSPAIGFAQADQVAADIRTLADQDESDHDIDNEKTVTGGPADIVIHYDHTVTPRTIRIGSVPYKSTKMKDFATVIETALP